MNEEALAHWGLLRQKEKEANVFTKSSLYRMPIFFSVFVN
jgi:hypothetical protein